MPTLFAARTQARNQFEGNRRLAAGSKELSESITHAEEVAKFLRENVVQGQAIGSDGYYSTEKPIINRPFRSFFANSTC